MSLYASDGSINITVGTGTPGTNLQAADGSYNVVKADGTGNGAHHPNGGLWVTKATANPIASHAPDGSLYVEASPYSFSTAQRVTVVTGSL